MSNPDGAGARLARELHRALVGGWVEDGDAREGDFERWEDLDAASQRMLLGAAAAVERLVRAEYAPLVAACVAVADGKGAEMGGVRAWLREHAGWVEPWLRDTP